MHSETTNKNCHNTLMKKKKTGFIKRLSKFIGWTLGILVAISLIEVVVLKWAPVKITPLMVKRLIEHKDDSSFKSRQQWTSLDKISPNLKKAVVTAEDNHFAEHNGFDFESIKKSIQQHIEMDKKLRGASTISQQTAKNVFLLGTGERTKFQKWLRKAVEAYYTVLIELIWGKERILEVYLNVAEMGDGIYGAEAAAMAHFGIHASQLTVKQSCLIAACLPNPIRRNAGHPSRYVEVYANTIQRRLNNLIYPDWFYSK